jgi:mono/diheme cytochrome c family protein
MNIQAAVFALVIVLGTPGWLMAQDKAQLDRGAQVYAAQKCTICHSIAGKGNLKGPLDGVGAKLKVDDIRAWIVTPIEMTKKTNAERKPPMKAFANLLKEDLDALVAYLASLK